MPAATDAHDPSVMSFGDHLEELRRRLIYALLGLLPIFVVSLALGRSLLGVLILPVQDALRGEGLAPALQATSPLETFGAYVRISVVVTVLVGSPWALYQLWLFVAPGLYGFERRFVYLLAPMSGLLAGLAVAFMYWVMLPVVLAFFVHFGSTVAQGGPPTAPLPPGLTLPMFPVLAGDPPGPAPGQAWINGPLGELRVGLPDGSGGVVVRGSPLTSTAGIVQQYRVSEYVKLIMSLALAFAAGFQTPIVVLLLGWAGVLTPDLVARYRRHAAMVCLVASAVLTPADPFSMVLLAVPLYALLELGVLMLRWLPAERVATGRRPGPEPADAGDP